MKDTPRFYLAWRSISAQVPISWGDEKNQSFHDLISKIMESRLSRVVKEINEEIKQKLPPIDSKEVVIRLDPPENRSRRG